MKRFERESRVGLQLGIALSLAGVLLLDVLTPIGIVVWVLYLVPVTLSVFLSRPAAPLLAAGCGSALTLAGIWLSPVNLHFPVEVARLNRGIGALALWVVALIVRQAVLTRLRVREQDWVRSGERDLGLRTQGERRVEVLADGVLRFLCEYLDAAAGVLYVKDTDGRFSLRASWALAEDAHVPESLAPGVGLLGQALKEGRPLRLDEVPEGYLPLASALLRARPRHLVAVPASADGEVVAGIELAFAHEVGISDMDLLATTAEPIAVALRTAQYRAQLEELLEETQRQAEELQAQQEELRVTNEELEEQSRALQESQARLETQQAELEQTNAQLEEQASAARAAARRRWRGRRRELVERAEQLRAREPVQVRVPRQHVPRAAHAAQLRADPGEAAGRQPRRQPDRRAGASYAADHLLGRATTCSTLINDILDLSKIEAGACRGAARAGARSRALVDDARARRSSRSRAAEAAGASRSSVAPGAADGDRHRPAAAAADPEEPALERAQVHRARRRSRSPCRGRPGDRVALRGARHRHRHRRRPAGDHLRGLPPGRRQHAPQVRRHRASGSRSRASWRACWAASIARRERAGQRQHLHARRCRVRSTAGAGAAEAREPQPPAPRRRRSSSRDAEARRSPSAAAAPRRRAPARSRTTATRLAPGARG